MTSGTVYTIVLLALSCTSALAQQQAQFNQVLNINGDMALNSFIFPDQSKIETFSQKQQQLIVNQQNPSIPANQITGTTGQPFVAVSPLSMTLSTNGATDLVGGQIQMAMSQQLLQQAAVQPDNTYVAMLSPDRQSWMIQETLRSINATDMTVRMVKRAQLDGEYMIVGRQSVEVNTLVVPFGKDPANTVAITGSGLQENEFQDGFRMSIRAAQPLTMNVDVKDGIDSSMLAALQGQESVNDYRYSVTTNLGAVIPDLNQQVAVLQMPINPIRIQKMMQAAGVLPTGQVAIGIAQRGVLQNPGGATGNLGGAAGLARRSFSRGDFRAEVARQRLAAQKQRFQQTQNRQQQTGQQQNGQQQTGQQVNGQQQDGQQQQQTGQQQTGQLLQGQGQIGTPTIENNPVAAQLLLAPTFTPVQATAVLDQVNMRIAVPVRQIDGEYILIMQVVGGNSVQPIAAQPSQGQQGQGQQSSGSNTSTAAGERPSGAPVARNIRRQENKDKYGDLVAPQGAVMMTMKMIDQMVDTVQWGGQAPITKMMGDYVKQQTGQDLFAGKNGTAQAASLVALSA